MQILVFLGVLVCYLGLGITSPWPIVVAVLLSSIYEMLTRAEVREPLHVRALQFLGLFFWVNFFTNWMPIQMSLPGFAICAILAGLLSPNGFRR